MARGGNRTDLTTFRVLRVHARVYIYIFFFLSYNFSEVEHSFTWCTAPDTLSALTVDRHDNPFVNMVIAGAHLNTFIVCESSGSREKKAPHFNSETYSKIILSLLVRRVLSVFTYIYAIIIYVYFSSLYTYINWEEYKESCVKFSDHRERK